MGFAKTRQQLARQHHVLAQAEMPVGTEPLQVDQAVAYPVDPVAHEIIRIAQIGGMVEDRTVRLAHTVGNLRQRVHPAVIVLVIGEAGIDACVAGLLVLEQQVGNACLLYTSPSPRD